MNLRGLGVADKPKRKSGSDSPGMLGRLSSLGGGGGWLALGGRVLTGVIVVVLAGGWALSRGSLERRVASYSTGVPSVRIEWPTVPDAGGEARTWVPSAVRSEMEEIVTANVSSDPFDRASLDAAADRLRASGWFATLREVRRRAGGLVTVSGTWRVPAAVVMRDGRSHLVAMDGAVLRLPSTVGTPDRLFQITNPMSPPPKGDHGGIVYGVPWPGSDVQSAIALLKLLHARPQVARQIAGVDLGEFSRSSKLTLVTDRGHRIIWGSPLGETLPGEVAVERKIARLEQNLKDFGRIDADQHRVEIYTPVVLVDKTARE